jgi:hypothetical protein
MTRKLSDVADAERGYEDPPTFLIRHNGEPALILSVVMKEGWHGLDLGKALEVEVKKIARELPLDVTFSKITPVSLRMWSGRRRVHGTLGIRFTMLPAFVVAAIGIALTIMVTALGNSVEARVRRTKAVRLFYISRRTRPREPQFPW